MTELNTSKKFVLIGKIIKIFNQIRVIFFKQKKKLQNEFN